jgi:hypothetical protein
MTEEIKKLRQEYDAILANAWPGDEEVLLAKIVQLGTLYYEENFNEISN